MPLMMKQTILLLALAAPIIKADVNHEAFDEAGKAPFTKSADDPRDEDIAFFYAEEANHDAEDAIFKELYGTSTTTVPPPGW